MIFNTLISLLAMLVAADASPLRPQQLEVITPHITSPTAAVRWAQCSNQTITWDTTHIPPAFVNNTGMILLGHNGVLYDSKGNPQRTENLNTTHPLATHFAIGCGSVQISVPCDIPPRSTYIVVLFGDSGNCSPEFTIAK
ncbi:hypothetical protein B0H19DRAFT_1250057 [Mycena capillaripes]|nr:hypothetical protein B0H19DRAFT_1250057 [Mycena capillaripes]